MMLHPALIQLLAREHIDDLRAEAQRAEARRDRQRRRR
jgi:hypothetical protein